MSGYGAVAKNVLRQIRRDRRTLAMIVLGPLVIMVLFGYSFAGEPHDIGFAVVNDDSGTAVLPLVDGTTATLQLNLSQAVVDSLGEETLSITYYGNEADARALVETGQAWAFLHIEAEFTQTVLTSLALGQHDGTIRIGGQELAVAVEGISAPTPSLTLYIDKTNTQVAGSIMSTVMGGVQTVMEERQGAITMETILATTAVYGERSSFFDFFVPGILVLVATMMTMLLTLVSFVRERTSGTLDRLLVSPIRFWEINLGYMLAYGLIAVVQSLELMGIAILIFGISIEGSVILALAIIGIYSIGIQSLGTLLSVLAQNEYQAVQFLPMIFLPFIILGGVLWPIESMPGIMRTVASWIPITYAADGLRSVMVRGWGVPQLWQTLGILVAFMVAMSLLSLAVMKKRAYA